MDSGDAAKAWEEAHPPFDEALAPRRALALAGAGTSIGWALVASTWRRIQHGEGALLAINLSLVLHHVLRDGASLAQAWAPALVSMLTIGVMYAFNDLHDAPTDRGNPKKDPALIGVYEDHRTGSVLTIAVLKLFTLVLAASVLSPSATIVVAGAMAVNLIYSLRLKGVPVIDVAWCGLWGGLYAAIVTTAPWTWGVVALMTAICHLYQALDDRAADAAHAIVTTAVRSRALSTAVLTVSSVLLFLLLRGPLGAVWAATAFLPLAIYFAGGSPRRGWLLTKAYFGVLWLYLLEVARAAG